MSEEHDGVPLGPSELNDRAWSLRWSDRRACFAAARRAAEISAADDNFQAGLAHRTMTWARVWTGAFPEAETDARMARECLGRLDTPDAAEALSEVDGMLAVIHYSKGRYDLARAAGAAGLARIAGTSGSSARASLLITEGTVLRHLGRAEAARAHYSQALDIADLCGRARALHNFARFYIDLNEDDDAFGAALGAVAAARSRQNRVVLPYALEILGAVHMKAARYARAEDCLADALAVARENGDDRVEAQILFRIGLLDLQLCRARKGIARLEEGHRLCVALGYEPWQQRYCKALANAFEAQGDLKRALDAMKRLDGLRKRQVA